MCSLWPLAVQAILEVSAACLKMVLLDEDLVVLPDSMV